MKTFFLWIATFGAALSVAASAAAQGIDPNAVVAAASAPAAEGVPANVVELVESNAKSRIYKVKFADTGLVYMLVLDVCGGPTAACGRLGYQLWFNKSAGSFSPQQMNAWNQQRPPQAFINTDGGTGMIHYIFAPDGVTPANLRNNFDFWHVSVIQFTEFLRNAPRGGQTVSLQTRRASIGPAPVHSAENAHFGREPSLSNASLPTKPLAPQD